MRKFKDATGREWNIELLCGDTDRILRDSGGKFDLTEPAQDELAKRLDDKLPLFWELLWYVVEEQAGALTPPVSAKEFGRVMAGDHLIAARDQFFHEWADFFRLIQRPQQAAALELLVQVRRKRYEQLLKQIDANLSSLPDLVDKDISRQLDNEFAALRASLESILNATPGENSTPDTKESSSTNGE